MAWLIVDGRVLASADVAASRAERTRGLLGRDGHDGALVLEPCRWIHTVGMRFPLDIAYVGREGEVLKTLSMAPHRVGVPMLRARSVIEAERGAFSRWGLRVGDRVEIRSGP